MRSWTISLVALITLTLFALTASAEVGPPIHDMGSNETDAGNPFTADMGTCSTDADCPEGYACGNGQCEFFDAVGDMGLGGGSDAGHGGDAGNEGDDMGGEQADDVDDDSGCSTASGGGLSPFVVLLGLLAFRRRD